MLPTKVGGDLDTCVTQGVMGLRVRCVIQQLIHHHSSAPALEQATDVSAQEEARLISADLVSDRHCCGHAPASSLGVYLGHSTLACLQRIFSI